MSDNRLKRPQMILTQMDKGEKMKKFMTIAVVLMMVFAFGIVGIHAQQTDTKNHGTMMMGTDCQMMAKAENVKCAMGNDGKCPMAADKCPMASHHGSETSTAPDHGAN
jgi:hypothetical protein